MRALLCVLIFAFGCDDGGDPTPRREAVDGALDDAAPDGSPADRGPRLDAAPTDMRPADVALDAAPVDMAPADMAADAAATDMTRDGAATDGAATDGAATDGAATDGAATDGAATDGAATDGAATDGAATDGAPLDLALDASPPDMMSPDRCARWQDVPDADLVAALHLDVQQAYRPIEPEADRGGNLNRYTTSRHAMFTDAERVPDEAGRLGAECVYTGRFTALGPDDEPDHANINAEHVWPRARMDDERDSALYAHQQSDIHNLYPSDSNANSTRGSFPFGVVVADRNLDHLPALAGLNADGDRVFEPRDARKGDVARTTFYFSVRWGVGLDPTEERIARAWADADPPDARERLRNDRIEGIQGNRNPFADCPALMERIADFADFPIRDMDLALP